jgi:hypothetical protein
MKIYLIFIGDEKRKTIQRTKKTDIQSDFQDIYINQSSEHSNEAVRKGIISRERNHLKFVSSCGDVIYVRSCSFLMKLDSQMIFLP